MTQITRIVKVTTTSRVLEGVKQEVEGYPMREWSVQVHLVGPSGEELPATLFSEVTFHLHPTFENPTRTFKKPPFKLTETGWGEFDLGITLHTAEHGGDKKINHDLNFLAASYDVEHKVAFKNPSAALLKLLAESGPIGEAEGDDSKKGKRKHDAPDGPKKKNKLDKLSVDVERLAEGLEKLGEDDLLHVVQVVTDNKTPDMYIKNDVDEGEFHIDLFTLPDSLLKTLWDFVIKRADI
ncbi:yeats family-domain-containing protein [Lipomyces japonicus]|uniref:yeats family-domain-containing protein n=1 Tax=Lipomyces japonicus TaxID=56871 RepID=UPI0034CDCF8F